MVDEVVTPNDSNSVPVISSRRKNLIGGIDDAHLALGGVGLLAGLGIIMSWPKIQEWISNTFMNKAPVPNGSTSNTAQVTVPAPPPVVVQPPQPQVQQGEVLPYPYLQRRNINPVGQAVSVSAMETAPADEGEPQQQPQKQQKRNPNQYQNQSYSPFGASISGEVG